MAKQTKSSLGLKARLQRTSVRDETRTKEAEAPGGGSLPAGVSGIAKLTRLDFNVMDSGDYAGEQRLYAHGVCVKPTTFKDSDGNVHNVAGALVQLNKINLCDTKNRNGEEIPFEENWAKAENRLKLLGIPTEDMDDEDIEEQVLDYVKSTDIYFRFRTWKPDDQDRVNVVLEGPAEFNEDEEGDEDVQDDTEDAAPVAKKENKKEQPKPSTKNTPAVKEDKKSSPKQKKLDLDDEQEQEPKASSKKEVPKKKVKDEEPAEEESTELSPNEIKKLGKEGDKGDEESQVILTDLADKAGVDTTDYSDWGDVAEAIIAASKGTAKKSKKSEPEDEEEDSSSDDDDNSGDDEEEEETPSYEKGDIVSYKKNKKEHEVVGVFPAKGIVTLKDLESGKLIKSVPYEMISPS